MYAHFLLISVATSTAVAIHPESIYLVSIGRVIFSRIRLVCEIECANVCSFLQRKEELKSRLPYSGHFYSDFPYLSSLSPYFWAPPARSTLLPPVYQPPSREQHLIVCVHGMDGTVRKMRSIRNCEYTNPFPCSYRL